MPNGEQGSATRMLLVEGNDDLHVVTHIRIRASIPKFEIETKGSIDELAGLNSARNRSWRTNCFGHNARRERQPCGTVASDSG